MTSGKFFNPDCKLCPRLAGFLSTVKEQHVDYHARPVASFGAKKPRLFIVGLAPGMHGANRTGRPFTGDFAGVLLYKTLFKLGFSSRESSVSEDDGLVLKDCRISNAVKCLPPANKPIASEVNTCNRYLREELRALAKGAVILSLGGLAHGAVLRALGHRKSAYPFGHGREYALPDGQWLLTSYHCSRYNTQTRRLTEEMFLQVMQRAQELTRR